MPVNNRYIHILFRSNSLFLLLGSILVPAAITLDVRAAGFMAPVVLFLGWHWGMMAGTTFGLALIISIRRFTFISNITKRRYWLLIGLVLGLVAGVLISVVAGVDMLREMALQHGNNNDPTKMLLRMIIVPSAICGCLCAGLVLYPNDLNIRNSSPKNVWVRTDMLWALPIVFLISIKFAAFIHG